MRPNQTAAATAGLALLALLFHQLHRWNDLTQRVVETIAVGLLAGAVYFVALFALERTADRRAAFWLILLGALLFRLQLFPLAPALSDDLLRYRWDGRIQAAGWNPYAVRPDDPRLAALRDDSWAKTPGRDVASIYPPLGELVFRGTYALTRDASPAAGLVLTKLPFLAADLGIVALLAWWTRATRGRNVQLAAYAWNPLVVVEFAANGHMDALPTLAALAASLAIIRGRDSLSTLLLAAGALMKLFPAVLAPLWLRRQEWPRAARSWWNLLAAAALAAVCAWPYRSAWAQVLDSLAYFESRWRMNNASLYALGAWFSGSADVAAGLGAGVVTALALWAAVRRMEAVPASVLLLGALLLLSPNAFSWYFTWMIPFLALLPLRAAAPWLLLTVLQFLSYHVLPDYHATGLWRFQSFYLWLTYGPSFVLLIVQLAVERNKQNPSAGASGE